MRTLTYISALVITKGLKYFCLGVEKFTLITYCCHAERVQYIFWGAKYRGSNYGGTKRWGAKRGGQSMGCKVKGRKVWGAKCGDTNYESAKFGAQNVGEQSIEAHTHTQTYPSIHTFM